MPGIVRKIIKGLDKRGKRKYDRIPDANELHLHLEFLRFNADKQYRKDLLWRILF